MPTLDSVVKVTVKVEKPVSSQGSFGKVLILSSEPTWTDTFRTYSADTVLDDIVTDGLSATGTTAEILQALLGQDNRVSDVTVGNRATNWTQISELTATSITNNMTYSGKVNGLAFTFTADGTATATEVYTGIANAITALAVGTAVNTGDTKVTHTAPSANKLMHFTELKNLKVKDATAASNVVADYAAIKAEFKDFFFVLLDSPSSLDKLALAPVVNAENHFLALVLSDSEAFDSAVTNDTASTLNAANYAKVATFYHSAGERIDAAVVGNRAPRHPRYGDSWGLQQITGITLEKLSNTQLTNLENKGVNTFQDIGGADVIWEGKALDGSYIDLVTLKIALAFDVQVAAWNVLLAPGALSYSNASADKASASVENTLKVYVRDGSLKEESYKVFCTHPDVRGVAPADKAARILKGLKFGSELAGRLHGLEIDGSLSV